MIAPAREGLLFFYIYLLNYLFIKLFVLDLYEKVGEGVGELV